LRYLGITLRKLKKYNEALEVFQNALTREPTNVAVNYHTAFTFYKAGELQAAQVAFNTVVILAPESKYAGLARQYMDAISDRLARGQSPVDPKLFGFYGQLTIQHDSNVLATPDNVPLLADDSSGSRLTGYLSGQYFYVNKNGWLGSLDLSGYTAKYLQDRFKSIDVNQWNPGVSVQKSTSIGKVPVVNSIRYDYLNVKLDGEAYSESNVATLVSKLAFSTNTATRFTYRFTNDTFDFKGFDPAISSRDADNHYLNVLNTLYLNKRKVELDLGAGYNKNDAEGLNFNYDGWRIEAAGRFSLPNDWWFDIGAAWASEDYADFVGPVKRETDIVDANVAIRRWFKGKFLVQLDAAYHDEKSSYESLTYDRYNAALKFAYAY
jgi:tetratricopeptide (TPR) repeat protein